MCVQILCCWCLGLPVQVCNSAVRQGVLCQGGTFWLVGVRESVVDRCAFNVN